MKTYLGKVVRKFDCEVFVKEGFFQKKKPLDIRLDLLNWSPSGFNWGFSGSGPTQLAFAILLDLMGDKEKAISLCSDFMSKVISKLKMGKRWKLRGDEITKAIMEIETEIKNNPQRRSL